MTIMAVRPIYYGKNLKNLLLQNQLADGLETWSGALDSQILPSLFKLWPWVDRDLSYIKVKFDHLWEKVKIDLFLVHLSYRFKVN